MVTQKRIEMGTEVIRPHRDVPDDHFFNDILYEYNTPEIYTRHIDFLCVYMIKFVNI